MDANKRVSCICRTFGAAAKTPSVIAEAVYWFGVQDYPNKELIIVNDAVEQHVICDSPGVKVLNFKERIPSIGHKIIEGMKVATGEIILPWDDDDIHLPWRISQAVEKLSGGADLWSPRLWWFDQRGKPLTNSGNGYGINCSAFRRDTAMKHYPATTFDDRDFHYFALKNLKVNDDPCGLHDTPYVYRWGYSFNHLSGNPDMEKAYDKNDPGPPGRYEIIPKIGEDYVAKTRSHLYAAVAPQFPIPPAAVGFRANVSDKVLTVGMAAYGEHDNVWWTCQVLRAMQGRDFEILVVDTTPGVRNRHTENAVRACGGKYVHRPDLRGTAAPRDAVIRMATTPWVMCIDPHVFMEAEGIKAAIEYAKSHPASNDLIQGPLVYDDQVNRASHWEQQHPPMLSGTWASKPELKGSEPFEIPLQGLGQFMVRKEAWPGFHPLHRGFGGEEGYIHEKVRQRGGKALCHPKMGWVHKFRYMESGGPPPPYPLRSDDHCFNLLAGHRELGINAEREIRKTHATHMKDERWNEFVGGVKMLQPIGKPIPSKSKRLKLIGVWYSNNAAPPGVMRESLKSIQHARDAAVRHDVTVATCAMEPLPWNPFPFVLAKRDERSGHAQIFLQQCQVIELAGEFDAVVFLEHDVVYPEDYFDRMGDAVQRSPVGIAVNRDFVGLNEHGWQPKAMDAVPMHQIAMSKDAWLANKVRCQEDVERQGYCWIEPQSESRSGWAAAMPSDMSAFHVNYVCGGKSVRFTSHGDIVYGAAKTNINPYWGDSHKWWKDMGCGCGKKADANPAANQAGTARVGSSVSSGDPFVVATSSPSDFNEHVGFLKELADKCDHVTELSQWHPKATTVALGASKAKRFVSLSTGDRPIWPHYRIARPGRGFEGKLFSLEEPLPEIEETDLLLLDTLHQAPRILEELAKYADKVKKYVVITCSEIDGETSRDGGPGVMPAVRDFLTKNPTWVVRNHLHNNNGLIVLSRLDEDKKQTPSLMVQAMNFAKASAKFAASGGKMVSDEVRNKRLELCVTCPNRNVDRCGLCGCYVGVKSSWSSESCPDNPPKWTAEAA